MIKSIGHRNAAILIVFFRSARDGASWPIKGHNYIGVKHIIETGRTWRNAENTYMGVLN